MQRAGMEFDSAEDCPWGRVYPMDAFFEDFPLVRFRVITHDISITLSSGEWGEECEDDEVNCPNCGHIIKIGAEDDNV
jgi:hypothetical protein